MNYLKKFKIRQKKSCLEAGRMVKQIHMALKLVEMKTKVLVYIDCEARKYWNEHLKQSILRAAAVQVVARIHLQERAKDKRKLIGIWQKILQTTSLLKRKRENGLQGKPQYYKTGSTNQQISAISRVRQQLCNGIKQKPSRLLHLSRAIQ